MDEQMLQQLAQAYMQVQEASPEEAEQQVTQLAQAAQQGNKQAIQILQQLEQVAQQMAQQSQAQAARYGAKLNYMRSIIDTCPDGYEITYFKKGGRVCKQCMKKAKTGSTLQENKKPLTAIEEFKCGRKIKKNKEGDNFGKQGNQMLAEAKPHEMVGTKQFKERQQGEAERKKRQSITYNEKDHKALVKKYKDNGYSYKNFTPEEKTRLGAYNERTAKN